MDRKALAQYTHKVDDFLNVSDSNYKQWIFRYTFLELEKDLGLKGDISSQALFHDSFVASAKIIAKEDGIIAGLAEIKYFLVDSDKSFRPRLKSNFELKIKKNDGDGVREGDEIMEITGEVHDLLAVERVILNLLMRMSGVATFTKKIVEMIGNNDVLLCPTRKTLWGLLDKKAVLIGGGGTHRLNLADAILIKDNHLALKKGDMEAVFNSVDSSNILARFMEIEVEDKKQAIAAGKEFNKRNLQMIGVIMFDNMAPEAILEAMRELKKENLYDKLLFEASGGITEKTVQSYAKTGVDIISMGGLTAGVKSLDLGMEIVNSR